MPKMNLAQQLKEAGIQVGDLVELLREHDAIDFAIAEHLGEGDEFRRVGVNGELVEITAIGEEKILGYWVIGCTRDTMSSDCGYDNFSWYRYEGEKSWGGERAFRKVGYWAAGGYQFLFPKLQNVWSRH